MAASRPDEAPKPGGVRRAFRIIRKLIFAVLGIVAVAAVIVLIAVHTSWGRNKIRGIVEDQLASTFAGGAKVKSFEGSILGDFTLEGVELFDAEGKPAITIGKLHANAAIWKLGRKLAELEHLELEDLAISIGKAPLTKPPEGPPSDEPATWSVSLPSVKVQRGSFELRGGEPMSLDGIAVTGAIAIPAGGAISVTELEVGARWREKQLPIVLTGSVQVDAGVSIPDAKLRVGELALVATDLVIDTQQPTGTVKITGSPEAIAAVVPQVELPAGLDVELQMRPSGRAADVSLAGKLGDAEVHGALHADLEKRTVAGWLGAGKINLRRLLRSTGSRPPVNVRGELALAVTADRNGVRGILGVHGTARELPESDVTIAIDATWKEAAVTVLATGEGDARVAIDAKAKRDGKRIEVERARVVASAKQLAPATGDRVPVVARELVVDARLVTASKPSTIAPTLDLVFDGSVRGSRVAYDDLLVSGFDTSFTGSLRDKLYVQSTTRVAGVYQRGTPLGSGTVAANLLPDRRIFSRVDLRPAAVPVGVVASAYITPGPVTTIALADHVLSPTIGAAWSGRGGTITIDSARDLVDVRGVVTSSGSGRARVDATLRSGTLEASLDAQGVPVSAVAPAYRGAVSGKLAIKRRGLRWDGGGTLAVAGLVVDPKAPTFDGDVKVNVAGRVVTLDAHAENPQLGGARLELDVEGPRDLTDAVAWKRLERTAVRTALITVDKVTLDAVSPKTGGKVDGKLRIGGTEVEGAIEVRSVATPLGTAEGTVTFSPLGNDLFASWNAMLSDVGEANIGLRVTFPQHPFDPAGWQQLGRGVVHSLTASFDDIAVDPAKLSKLGVVAPYSGRADIRLAVGSAATAATLDVDLRAVEGGILAKPIDVHVEATTDGTGTVASACVARAKDPRGDACAKGGLGSAAIDARKLFAIEDARTPVTFDTWMTAPVTALAASVQGTISIPSQSAPEYFALVGRNVFDPKRGTIEGTITVGGTLGKPTGKGSFSTRKLQLISQVEGRLIPELTEMEITGDWDGAEGNLKITAKESNKGDLTFDLVAVAPNRLGDAKAKLQANRLDLAPLAAFLPGELAASQGELNGLLTVKSLDLATARVTGGMTITKADVPLHPMVGTLRNGELKLFAGKNFNLTAKGLINACKNPDNPRCTQNIVLDATSPPDLSTLSATLVATKVSTIGEIEPVIDGQAKVELARTGREWSGDIYLTKGRISVPVSTGDDLLDFETPEDIYFTDKPPKQLRFGEAQAPTKAWLDARVHLASTAIDVEEYGVKGSIVAREPLRLRLGDAVGLDGKISVEYGTADDIFGRSYEIEPNELVSFDGTIDPEIDLQLTHRFPDLTLRVIVEGRLSDADFPKAQFTADGGNYSESELFGFFLGGDPGGTSATQTADAAKGAGSSVVSQLIAKRLKAVLPEQLRFDVIGCEVATSNSGGSCTIGRRLNDGRVFVSLKHRLAPLPNENAEELLIQYYLSTEWFLEGTGGTGSIIGADLLWRRRW